MSTINTRLTRSTILPAVPGSSDLENKERMVTFFKNILQAIRELRELAYDDVKTLVDTPIDDFTGYDEKLSAADNDLLLINDSADANAAKKMKISAIKIGVPDGGSEGQILAKASSDDLDTKWINPSFGGSFVRQTVMSSKIDASGYANFISIGAGLAVNIDGTPTPVRIAFAAGYGANGAIDYVGTIDSDTSISSLTSSTTNFLFAERNSSTGVITLGKQTAPVIYSTSPLFITEKNSSTDSYRLVGYDNSTNYYHAQGFKLSCAAYIESIILKMSKVGSPTGNITVEIQTDNGGVPSNAVVTNGVSDSVAESSFSAAPGADVIFTFSTPPLLTAGTQYHFVIKHDRSVSTTNYSQSQSYVANGAAYANGSLSYSNNTPSWTSVSGDMVFAINMKHTWFNVADMTMYQWDGATWAAKQLVFLGEAITDGSGVTSVTNYALRGKYDTGDIATTSAPTSKNHNIGTDVVKVTLLEGPPWARTQIMSKDFSSITRNSITWSAAAGISRLIVERGF